MAIPELTDLGLTYEEALHGMQSAVMHEQALTDPSYDYKKHLRVGINSAMSEHSALAILLMQKGVITEEEYFEAIRLGANAELDRYQKKYGATFR